MAETESERLLKEIGQLLMADEDYPTQPTLLYVEVDYKFVRESIFKDLGNQLLFRWPLNRRLPYALLELWGGQEGKQRWSDLEYVVRDGRFAATYFYPDDLDPNEDNNDRRERALRRHFGDKPIVYPDHFPGDGPDDDRLN